MITILHGQDLATSRNYYLSERSKHPEKLILEGSALTLTDFLQAVSGNGLFGDQKTIFIEELLSKRKQSHDLDALLTAIQQYEASEIYLWESKDLTPKQLKYFPKATVKQFKVPQTVFAFLDSLMPGNGKKSIVLFHTLLQDEDASFVLFMLQRQVRILLAMQSSLSSQAKDVDRNQNAISEVSRLAPWQKGKLQKQANAFSLEKLIRLHDDVYTLEREQKTGGLSQPLEEAIDFLLLSM